jgi:hypothetical protein
MTTGQTLIIESIKALFAVGLLCLTWFFGQKILTMWDLRKKRREADLQAIQRFQELFGEWKAVWRSWKVYKSSEKYKISVPDCTRWTLLERAAAAEGGVEAIVTRLALERRLNERERNKLGLFRQSFQQLREAIRGDTDLAWTREDVQYWLLHNLAVCVASILDREPSRQPMSVAEGENQLRDILKVKMEDWESAVKAASAARK